MKHSRRPGRSPAVKPKAEAQGTITVESIASGGDGVGRIDGLACFVPRTAPGDRAQVAYVAHARHARGRVLQLLDESPDRVAPRCHHYVEDRCGGCQLQHVSDAAQRLARSTIVRDALRRIGKRDVPLPDIAYGESWEYRGRLTLTLLRRGNGWIGGLHPHDDASRVFALTECPIAHPSLVAAWVALAPGLRALPDARSLRIGIRLLDAGQTASPRVVLVIDGGAEWPGGREWAERSMSVHTPIHAVWWTSAAGARALLAGDAQTESALPLAVPREDAGGAPVVAGDAVDDMAPTGLETTDGLAFAQVNGELAVALRAHVLAQVLSFSPRTVVDGYAGVGLLAEALTGAGISVTAIESDRAATASAEARLARVTQGSEQARAEGVHASSVITARMEDGLAASLPADVVVLNPPRRGIDAAVSALLAGAASRGVRGIVYVSCDPATLARDLTRLPRWTVRSLQCFDMFPQTAHVESVCVLVPEES